MNEYISDKIIKLNDSDIPLKSNLFKDIHVYITGYTVPSRDELKICIIENGGKFHHFYSSKSVTHIVTNNLTIGKDFKNKIIVKPNWIVDSIKQNKILLWSNYALNNNEKLTNYLSNHKEQNFESNINLVSSNFSNINSPSSPSKNITQSKFQHFTPLMREKSSMNPNFVKSFFANSRLHHLSTWKSKLKHWNFRHNSQQGNIIMHVDMDCFFASVALLDKPQYSSVPVGISHGGDTGEIASCNYVARESGVKNGMFVSKAKLLCPALVILPYEFEKYEFATTKLYNVLQKLKDSILTDGIYLNALQACSCDEALLEWKISEFVIQRDFLYLNKQITETTSKELSSLTSVLQIAQWIREQIFLETKCQASIGIGSNVLQSRISTRFAKPSGIYFFHLDNPVQFMSKIPLAHLPGIGYQTIDKLKQAFGEVTTCGDLLGRSLKGKEKNSDIKEIHIHESSDDNEVVNYNQDYKPIVSKLQKCLGAKTGLILYNYLIGLDSSKISDSISISLNEDNLKKSISVEINWGVRFESMTQVKIFLNALNSELVERMKEEGTKGVVGSKLTFHLRTRHVDAPFDPAKFLGCGHCDKTSKSFNFSKETNDVDTLTTASLFLFDSILKSLKLPIEEVRGVGLQISGLSSVEKKNPLSKYFNADSTSPTKQQLSSPKQKTKIPDESNFVNNNITISQIDYSVFNQLPDNLKQEYNSFFKTNTPKRQKLQHSKHDKIIPVISEFRPIEIDGFVSSGDEILDEMLLNHEWVLAQNYIQVNGLSHDLLNSLMKFI